jgi:holo-ACP synthase CitX
MKATLDEVLAERERRSGRQKELLAQYGGGHDMALVCLTLNIAGDEKVFPLSFRCFQEERRIVRVTLKAENIDIIHEEATENNAGYAALLCVYAPPERVKTIAVHIEDSHPLGRLFDIDVIAPDGEKLSRTNSGETGRKCLVCRYSLTAI